MIVSSWVKICKDSSMVWSIMEIFGNCFVFLIKISRIDRIIWVLLDYSEKFYNSWQINDRDYVELSSVDRYKPTSN